VFTGINKRAVYIISKKSDAIKKDLLEKFERGVTSIRVIGEYSKQDREMLVVVLSISEYYRLRAIIETYDPQAFYYSVRASEVRGEGFSYGK
ncbi:MAG: YitT family protein, partial [Bacilli bacterium]|nr:YitT family protein [Bacilli bacterium]